MILAALVLKERITRITGLAVVLAFAGLLFIEGGNPLGGDGLGDGYVALGVLSASAYTVVVKRFPEEPDTLALTAIQFTAATGLAGVVVSARWMSGAGQPPSGIPVKYWCVACLTGIFGYAASFVLFNGVIAGIKAGAASVVLNLIPVFGVLSAVLFLGETLTADTGFGALLIGSSVTVFVVLESRRQPEGPPVWIPDQLRPADRRVTDEAGVVPDWRR